MALIEGQILLWHIWNCKSGHSTYGIVNLVIAQKGKSGNRRANLVIVEGSKCFI